MLSFIVMTSPIAPVPWFVSPQQGTRQWRILETHHKLRVMGAAASTFDLPPGTQTHIHFEKAQSLAQYSSANGRAPRDGAPPGALKAPGADRSARALRARSLDVPRIMMHEHPRALHRRGGTRQATIEEIALLQLGQTLENFKESKKLTIVEITKGATQRPKLSCFQLGSVGAQTDFLKTNVRYHAASDSKEGAVWKQSEVSTIEQPAELAAVHDFPHSLQTERDVNDAVTQQTLSDKRIVAAPTGLRARRISVGLTVALEDDSTAGAKTAKDLKTLHDNGSKKLSPCRSPPPLSDFALSESSTPDLLSATIEDSTFRITQDGTVHVGNWKIGTEGIRPAAHLDATPSHSKPRLSFSDSFAIVGPLGSGASGSVVEAIHLPTLKLVAIKMLPVYNPEKRKHIAGELQVLYKQLDHLHIVDESLDAETAEKTLQNLNQSMLSPPLSRAHLGEQTGDFLSDEWSDTLDTIYESRGREHDSEEPEDEKGSTKCENILSFYDAFVDGNGGYIHLVVEYMDGGSLQDMVLQGGCQDESVLADISYQVLKGLRFLHRHRHMHRDIKPGNILINSVGFAKIADFGISRAMDGTRSFATSFVGTVCYMSPERISANKYSLSSDIWSFGLTMLAVSGGTFPLNEGMGYWDLMASICETDPPLPGDEFSPEFRDFIKQSLSKDPHSRPSARELLEHPFIVKSAAYIRDMDLRKAQPQLTDAEIGGHMSAISEDVEEDEEGERTSLSKCRPVLEIDSDAGKPDPPVMSPLSRRVHQALESTSSPREADDIQRQVRRENLDRILDALSEKIYLLKEAARLDEHEETNQEEMVSVKTYEATGGEKAFSEQPSLHAAIETARVLAEGERCKSTSSPLLPEAIRNNRSKPRQTTRFGRSLSRNHSLLASALVPPPANEQQLHLNHLAKWKHLAAQLHLPVDLVLERAREALYEI